MRNEIRTEYAAFGLKPDGTWRQITERKTKKELAEALLKERLEDIKRYPNLYTAYSAYKIASRQVEIIFTEWLDEK